ncbi:MAG: PhzF family phenazine biosynthesis protein [Proteobacteria bacterium]|nr:PhzF family phenazine biosynthesis protein [Pseudomonadota bacterium]
MQVPFTTVDVFTDRKFGGNPLAVVTDARGLSDGQMQAIAAEFNLAETTFVLPPGDPAHTAEVRIFTPKAELPFAGHPNVGTAFVLASTGECLGRKAAGDRLVFEEKAGLVPLDVVRDNGAVIASRLAAPQPLTLGDEIAIEIVAEACSLAPDQIVTRAHRPIVASCGVGFVMVELASRAALAAAQVRADAFVRHLPMERAVGIHLYVPAKDGDLDIQSRMFAPLYGVPEDPATGSANVALIGLLAHLDARADIAALARAIGQGFDMGRPSLLQACAEKKAGTVTATYIGGRCVPMMRGTIEL